MKKIIALLACLCLLLPMSVYFVAAAENVLTVKEAIDLALSQEHDVYPETKYTVTAEIKEVYNEVYGNMRVVDAEGNVLTLYGTWSADGTLRYDAMEVKPVAGDTITVTGVVGQYNGTPQIKNGWIVDHIPGEGGNEPEAPAVSLVDAPVAGTAYKFGMIQPNVSATAVYYLDGTLNGFYMNTVTNLESAIDVYLEATEGGYYLYTLNGDAKTYINMIVSGTYVNGAYEDAASTVYTYNTDSKTIIANVNDADYWIGTRNDKTYTTVGPCKVEYAGFYCQFYAVESNDDNVGGDDNGDEPTEPVGPKYEVATELKADVAYKLGLDQTALGETYYFIGEMAGYYGATDTDVTKGVDMYIEIVDGGYMLYFNDASGAKQYVKLVQSGTHYNFTFGAEGSIFTLDTEKNALCAQAGDQLCYMGNYGTYFNISTLTESRLSDTDYIARLYVEIEEEDDKKDDDLKDDEDKQDEEDKKDEDKQDEDKKEEDENDKQGETDPMGENTAIIALAAVLMTLAAAGVIVFNKKRA